MCREVWGFESLRGHQKFRKKAADFSGFFVFRPPCRETKKVAGKNQLILDQSASGH